MGGKKKTKWRKLPLEEFTKEISSKPEKVPPVDTCQRDLTREENKYIPSNSETAEIPQNYVEPYEYNDGLWYPTSCFVYNPGMYSNYMMPVDTCYYYYTMPEAAQMQEYVPMAYQEYTPALPKDTVYLLLPTQTLRQSQPVQNLVPEWQNRRRGRRYEGYADYAEIPEKPSSTKIEEKDYGKVPGQHVSSRRNSSQFNSYKKMTSFTETNKFDDSITEQSQNYRKSNDGRKNSASSASIKKGPNFINKEIDTLSSESSQIPTKNPEVCGVHSRSKTVNIEQQITNEKVNSTSLYDELYPVTDGHITHKANNKTFSSESGSDISKSSPSPAGNASGEHIVGDKIQEKNRLVEHFDKTSNTDLSTHEISDHVALKKETKTNSLKPKDNILQQISVSNVMHNVATEDDIKMQSQSSLPDILSTLNKIPNEKIRESDNSDGSHLSDNVDLDKGRSLKSKSLLSQTSYLPNFLSSEALHNEMEMELKQLQNLHSLQANQSIYKLAYDENLTDQSEADSRSPSPVDPESQVPSSLTSAEILIHEADSGSDAGSEDVELLPHRYESETFLNENKHVYVNKLSLAVELLRTQESLPYDDEFKRVVGENTVLPGVHTGGKMNLGFVEDSSPPNTFSIRNNFGNKYASTSKNARDVVSQCQLKHSANSSNDSAIFSDIEFSNHEDELCEPAKEAVVQGTEIQDNTEGIRAGYRRVGIQARHYFSPRAALPLNPCFCCIIM